MDTLNKPGKDSLSKLFHAHLDRLMLKLNKAFNELPVGSQRLLLVAMALCLAAWCSHAITLGITATPPHSFPIDSITYLYMLPMEKKHDTLQLIPLGKMKGEINGQFEAFYVAMDTKGNFYKNHNPSYSKERWFKSRDWEILTYRQIMEYDKHLTLLPLQNMSKSIKP